MMIEVDTVKGFQDYLPPDSLRRYQLKKIIEKYYRLYGFQPIETPLIEQDELMRSDTIDGEDEAVSDRFRLKDRGGRNLGLRYEFTFQLARIFKQNPNLKLPFKRYQIGENFRDEPLRTGRTRQFTQCDIDIIGDSSVNADAECLAVVADILNELGIEYEIQINNRKLLNAIIESVEIDGKRQILREIDKLDKLSEDQVKVAMKKYADTNQIMTLFKLMEKEMKFFLENKFDGAEEASALINRCKQYGINPRLRPSLVRGFSYYTGNIFEFILKGTKTALVGGGRYDQSIGKYLNRQIPAVGISFSLEALMGLCKTELEKLIVEPPAQTVIISIQQDAQAIALAQRLRASSISCILLFDRPGKALEYANAEGIPYALFVGENEVEKKKFTLRDLAVGKEKQVSEKQLLRILAKKK
ncbi:histidine--tRNA ligase [Candidatus Pacearchaeota archaeon]|nr:histidine--tRNA ligase [Candidatus Pacearchaeota archaeon]